MNTVIAFTPSQILAFCSAIVLISTTMQVCLNFFVKISAPNKKQDERLDNIERTLAQHDELFKRDLMRFELNDDSNRVTQRALLALLEHSIDGNDVDNLKRAKNELQTFLIDR